MKKELLLLAGLTMSGCTAPAYDAYTTPFGIFYNNGSEKDPKIVRHEQEHWNQYGEDPLFFVWYALVPQYACDAEIRANEAAEIFSAEAHPACEKLVLDK